MRQLLLFFTLAYGISWLIWLPLYLPHFGIKGLPVLPYHHAIGGLGPMLAAFIVALVGREDEAKKLAGNMFTFRAPMLLFVAMVAPFLILMLSLIITGKEISWTDLGTSKEFPNFSFLTFFLYNLIFFGFGEEAGWRGFALPRLLRHFNLFSATCLLTLFWALWHFPLFFYREGYVNMDVGGIIGWVISLFTGSILLSWMFVKSRQSILVCAVFHTTIDIAFTSSIADASTGMFSGVIITVWGLLLLLFSRKIFFKDSFTLK